MPTLRSKTEYVNIEIHQGRSGMDGGRLPGIKQRKRRSKSDCNQSNPPVKVAAVSAPSLDQPAPMTTRNAPIRCIQYGPHRKILYRRHKMCYHCNDWETRNKPGMGRKSSGNSRRNMCQGNHTSHIFPTTLKTVSYPSRQLKGSLTPISCNIETSLSKEKEFHQQEQSMSRQKEPPVTNVSSVNEELEGAALSIGEETTTEDELAFGDGHKATTTTAELANSAIATDRRTSVIRRLVDEIDRLEKVNQNLKDQNRRLKHRVDTEIEGTLHDAFDAAAKRHGKCSPKAIADAAFSIGGILNLASIELLRRLETKGTKYYQGSLIPSTGDIQRVFAAVEEVGKERVPFAMKQFPSGEGLQFEMEKLVTEVIRGFKQGYQSFNGRIQDQ